MHITTKLVQWFSKKQSTIEMSVFSEFVAMKHGIDTLRGLRCKLWMMGILISGPSCIYGDNQSVVHITYRLESVLRKINNTVCYHVHDSVTMEESLVEHIPIKQKVTDLMIKAYYV